MRIVITGVSGFLGGNVLRILNACRHADDVIGVARQPLRGACRVDDYADAPPGDVLIHLAENNDRAEVNSLGKAYEEQTLNTLNCLLSKGYSRVVYASSSVLYGDSDGRPHMTNDEIHVVDTYTTVKRRSEMEVIKCGGGIAVRLANIYGHGMSRNNVMSKILGQIPDKGSLRVRDITPVRDFLYVGDAAEGIVDLALGHSGTTDNGGLYNLGTGVGTSIGDLAAMALNLAGESDRSVEAEVAAGKSSCLILDYSETTAACGWEPRTSLRAGLASLLQHRKGKI